MSDESINIKATDHLASTPSESKSATGAREIEEKVTSPEAGFMSEGSVEVSNPASSSSVTFVEATNAAISGVFEHPEILSTDKKTAVPEQLSKKTSLVSSAPVSKIMPNSQMKLKSEESLDGDIQWPINRSGMNLDFYISIHESLRDVNKEKDMEVGKKILFQQNRKQRRSCIRDRSPIMDIGKEPFIISDIKLPDESLTSRASAPAVQNKSEIPGCSANISNEIGGIRRFERTIMTQRFSELTTSESPQYRSREISSSIDTEDIVVNHQRRVKRINRLTDLLHRIIRLDNYLASNPLAVVPGFSEIMPDTENRDCPYRPLTIRELEAKFHRGIRMLTNEPYDSEELGEMVEFFKTCVNDMVDRLHLLVDAMHYDDFVLKETRFYSDEPLVLEELRNYLPKLWAMARYNNMLLKQWTTEFLDYTISFEPYENSQDFYNIEMRVQSVKVQISDIHRSASRLLDRWRNPHRNDPEIMELTLIIAVSNIATTMYNSLANDILMTRCHLENRDRAAVNVRSKREHYQKNRKL